MIREKSILTGCKTEELFRFEKFPIHTFESGDITEDPCCDLIFDIGVDDGFVQLREIVSPELLYVDTHMNAVGMVWKGMRRTVAEIIIEQDSSNILELGGSNGLLSLEYSRLGGTANWTIVEPQPDPLEGVKASYIRGFFPDALDNNERYDTIVHTHMMEHVEDLSVFFDNLSKHININGRMIFAIPNMDYLYGNLSISVIHFEHTFYLSDVYVKYLLAKYGFEFENAMEYGAGHSLIYVAKYTGNNNTIVLKSELYAHNRKMLENWYKKYSNLVNVWNDRIEKEEKPVYLFGAHLSSQLFCGFGLNLNGIKAFLDNDSYKEGKRVSGTMLNVYNPEVLKDLGKVVVIVPETPYSNEIKEGILVINSQVEFW